MSFPLRRLALAVFAPFLLLAGCGGPQNLLGLDWSDAPAPYPSVVASGAGGARHAIVDGLHLGSLIDAESNGQPNATATGDDLGNLDDEDGVTFSALVPGQLATVTVVASAAGKLDAWLDFDHDGNWSTNGDQIFTSAVLAPGGNVLTFPVPAMAPSGSTYTCFRFSTMGGLSYNGLANDGEVEDYQVTILDAGTLLDWGDAPDGPYPTLAASNGAAHIVSDKLMLGTEPDAELDGQPTAAANGDDLANLDDEDGVTFNSPLIIGQTATVTVVTVGIGKLNAWVDFNHDGSWATAGDQVFVSVALTTPGTNVLTFPVPATATPGSTFARFRLSSTGGQAFTGLAEDGEVEDYRVSIEGGGGAAQSLDWGDAPDGPFPTLAANNGARHVIANGLFLGTHVDAELDGQPTAGALGDDMANLPDDEDGVSFHSPLTPGQMNSITVAASAPGKLDVWMDFNHDGSWATPGDQILTSFPVVAGAQVVPFLVPLSATGGGALPDQQRRRSVLHWLGRRWRGRGLPRPRRRRAVAERGPRPVRAGLRKVKTRFAGRVSLTEASRRTAAARRESFGMNTTRRQFLGSVGLGAVAMASRASGQGRPPNILFIMTDQQTANGLSCTGNPYVHTPALDALAAKSTRYERAYVSQPLCQPCRSSLQTGKFPHEVGVITNSRPVQGQVDWLGQVVRDAGYQTPYIGKWHVNPSPKATGYEPIQAKLDPEKTTAAVEYLRQQHDAPWFLTVSMMNPHNVCQLARHQELPDGPIPPLPADPNDLPPLPPNHAIPDHEPPPIREAWNMDRVSQYPTRGWSELDWRQYLWGYWRIIEMVDAQIGRVLAALEAGGHADNTAIVFLSDHGEGIAMEQWNQKQVLYDQVARVPFFVHLPGQQASVSNELVSPCLDIPVTIADLAGAKRPKSWAGQTLATSHDSRDAVFSETTFAKNEESFGVSGRLVRTKQHKYVIYNQGELREQLFDMDADPLEMRNLAVEAGHEDVLARHRGLLAEWAKATSDSEFPHLSS